MNIIERVKNILITPKTEWDVVNGESSNPMSLLTSYVIPLTIVSMIGPVLSGLLFAGVLGFKFFLFTAVISAIASIAGYYISIYVIDMLATNFGSEKDLNKSAQLVAYSRTPSFVAAALSFIPVLGWLIGLAGWAYSIYLMYLGIGPLKKTPEDKKVIYLVVAFLIMIAAYFVLTMILGAIIFSAVGFSGMNRFGI